MYVGPIQKRMPPLPEDDVVDDDSHMYISDSGSELSDAPNEMESVSD